MSQTIVFDFDGVLHEKNQVLPLTRLADMLFFDLDFELVILTSRQEGSREYVEDFLLRNKVFYTKLIMTPKWLSEEAEVPMWKLGEIKKLHNVLMVFEDNPCTVEILKEHGYPVIGVMSKYMEEVRCQSV